MSAFQQSTFIPNTESLGSNQSLFELTNMKRKVEVEVFVLGWDPKLHYTI